MSCKNVYFRINMTRSVIFNVIIYILLVYTFAGGAQHVVEQ